MVAIFDCRRGWDLSRYSIDPTIMCDICRGKANGIELGKLAKIVLAEGVVKKACVTLTT